LKISLPAQAPFLLSTVMYSHGWIQLPPFKDEGANAGFRYIDRLASGKVVEYSIEEFIDGVTISTVEQITQAEKDEIVSKVTWMLNLEKNFLDFYEIARDEPKLARAERRAQGRVLRSPTLFEDVVKTILTTNTLWAQTIRMTQALVNHYGDSLPADPARHAFPTAERLASESEETLRGEARLGYRAPYILNLAREVASGEQDLEILKQTSMPTIDLRKRLMTIKGVGPYAAANLLNLLGRYDYLPVDSWALKMVSYEWYNGEPVGTAEVEKEFSRWGDWKGLAYWFWDWAYDHKSSESVPS